VPWVGMLPILAEAWVRSRDSLDEICGGENGISTSLKISDLSVSINPYPANVENRASS
jgi:hypothetical protein